MKKKLTLFFALMLCAFAASAHQPRIVKSASTDVSNPEVSQAFYAELKDAPAEYRIRSDAPFRLYVGLLLPDLQGVRKDISAEISRLNGSNAERLALLDGTKFGWTAFFEPFGGDHYLWGPEFAAPDSKRGKGLKGQQVPAGTYIVKVFSPGNKGKYSLALGDLEAWPPGEIVNALIQVPRIKRRFFEKSFTQVFFNRFTAAFAGLFLILTAVLLLLARWIVRISRKLRAA